MKVTTSMAWWSAGYLSQEGSQLRVSTMHRWKEGRAPPRCRQCASTMNSVKHALTMKGCDGSVVWA